MAVDVIDMLTEPAFANDPWPVYAALRDHAPALAAPYSRCPTGRAVILSRFDDVRSALGSPTLFRAVPHDSNPHIHAADRRTVDPLYSPRPLQSHADKIRAIARELLVAVADSGHADFHQVFTEPFPVRVLLSLIGFGDDEVEALMKLREALMAAEPNSRRDGAAGAHVEPLSEELYGHFDALLDRREKQPADDLATRFAHTELGRRMSRTELLDALLTQVQAGMTLVTAALDCIINRLAADAQLQRAVHNEAARPRIIEEVLRIESPMMLLVRHASQDIVRHGVTISEGDDIMLLIGAANTDERQFNDPLAVDIDRARGHLAFGSGIHRCIGSHLARLELSVALEEIFASLGTFAIPADEQVDFHFTPVFRSAKTLPLQWEPSRPGADT
jgi:cytochrome P450